MPTAALQLAIAEPGPVPDQSLADTGEADEAES